VAKCNSKILIINNFYDQSFNHVIIEAWNSLYMKGELVWLSADSRVWRVILKQSRWKERRSWRQGTWRQRSDTVGWMLWSWVLRIHLFSTDCIICFLQMASISPAHGPRCPAHVHAELLQNFRDEIRVFLVGHTAAELGVGIEVCVSKTQQSCTSWCSEIPNVLQSALWSTEVRFTPCHSQGRQLEATVGDIGIAVHLTAKLQQTWASYSPPELELHSVTVYAPAGSVKCGDHVEENVST